MHLALQCELNECILSFVNVHAVLSKHVENVRSVSVTITQLTARTPRECYQESNECTGHSRHRCSQMLNVSSFTIACTIRKILQLTEHIAA